MVGGVVSSFGCCIEWREKLIVESAGWHDESGAMVKLGHNESVAPTIILAKEMGIIKEHGGCALRAPLVLPTLPPLLVVAVGGCALPP